MLRQVVSQLGVCALFALLGTIAQAREVSISLNDVQSTLVLNNPSAVSVSYDITCSKPDGSGALLTLTSQTLAPNARASHNISLADSGQCSGGAPANTGTDSAGKPFYLCNGSFDYSTAQSACGTGQSFCFPNTTTSVYACGTAGYWVKTDSASQYQTGCGAFGAIPGGMQVGIGGCGFFGQLKRSAAATCAFSYQASALTPTTTLGAVCCSSPVVASVCKITINSTATNAYLSSPSFMGGAAF